MFDIALPRYYSYAKLAALANAATRNAIEGCGMQHHSFDVACANGTPTLCGLLWRNTRGNVHSNSGVFAVTRL